MNFQKYLIRRGSHESVTLPLLLLLTITLSLSVNGNKEKSDKTTEKIYEPINGAAACFRRTNGTHQIGCSSSLNGNVGVLYLLDSEESLDWILKTGPHSPYVVVLYSSNFTYEIVKKFKNSDRISGALLLRENDTMTMTHSNEDKPFSTDLTCPNRGYGIYNETEENYCEAWNEAGSGLLYEDLSFPIFFVNDLVESQKIIYCFETFNKANEDGPRDWPLCAAQLQSHMFAAIDTETCLRRSNYLSINPYSVCDPLGDYNIWSTLEGQTEPYPENPEGSVIIIAARMDAASMFDIYAPGADSASTGIATLLTLVEQLRPFKDKIKNSDIKNVYFMLFNGEAFDYIGSSRIVYDILNSQFPADISNSINDNTTSYPALLKLKDIRYFIEIGQVAVEDGKFFIHTNEKVRSKTKLDNFIHQLVINGFHASINISVSDSPMGLPPASFQSFLKHKPDLPGIVITNHKNSFKNKYYNSIFDDASHLDYTYRNGTNDTFPNSIQDNIASLAAAVGNTVLQLISQEPHNFNPLIFANNSLVDELLHCYIVSSNCSLFRQLVGTEGMDALHENAYTLYVGVNKKTNPITIFTQKLMEYFQGDLEEGLDENNCSKKNSDKDRIFLYIWLDGSCYKTTTYFSEAVSPAFIIKDYDWTSGEYSSWAESVWQQMRVRIFLKPSLKHELLTLCFGFAVFAISFLLIGFVSKKSEILFNSRPV